MTTSRSSSFTWPIRFLSEPNAGANFARDLVEIESLSRPGVQPHGFALNDEVPSASCGVIDQLVAAFVSVLERSQHDEALLELLGGNLERRHLFAAKFVFKSNVEL